MVFIPKYFIKTKTGNIIGGSIAHAWSMLDYASIAQAIALI